MEENYKIKNQKYHVTIESDLKTLIPKFLQYLEGEMKSLVDDLKTKNIEGLEQTSHKLKGNLGGYGLHELGLIARDLNHLLKDKTSIDNDVDTIEYYIFEMKNRLDNIEITYQDP